SSVAIALAAALRREYPSCCRKTSESGYCGGWTKSERSSKPECSNAECRTDLGRSDVFPSSFEVRNSFGFRISDFGFFNGLWSLLTYSKRGVPAEERPKAGLSKESSILALKFLSRC